MRDDETCYNQFLQKNAYPRKLKEYELIRSSIYLRRHHQRLINFSSNDYLGLSQHPLLIARSQEYAQLYGVGSASSRLVAGNLTIYEKIEQQLAQSLGKPAALIFASGYQTNISVLEALLDINVLGQEPLIFSDKLCHASMLATTRYLGRMVRFRHNDLHHLEELLEKYQDTSCPKFILSESIYSMDGDQTDLQQFILLAKKYQIFLYIDDAHAVGVYGHQGWGKAPEYANDINIIMGTFSKGLGSFGGYIGCTETMRDYFVNKCRGFIYSTALSPAVLGAISAAIELIPTLTDERQKVINHANKLRCFLKQRGLNYGNSTSHIVPWIIGDAKKTLYVSQLLEENGILGATIRPPSVPIGQCRIRFCLSAAHSNEDLIHLMEAIQKVEQKL